MLPICEKTYVCWSHKRGAEREIADSQGSFSTSGYCENPWRWPASKGQKVIDMNCSSLLSLFLPKYLFIYLSLYIFGSTVSTVSCPHSSAPSPSRFSAVLAIIKSNFRAVWVGYLTKLEQFKSPITSSGYRHL